MTGRLLTYIEAGEELGCCAKTIARRVAEGAIRTKQIGSGRPGIPASEIDRVLALPPIDEDAA